MTLLKFFKFLDLLLQLAGNCIITFGLSLGERGLVNLMLLSNGSHGSALFGCWIDSMNLAL